MTDPIDLLLRDAGEHWRAAQPEPPQPDSSRWSPRRRSTRLVPLVAAASVVALAATTAVILMQSRTGAGPTNAMGTAGKPIPGADGSNLYGLESFVVHDGDLVEGSGEIEARPGKPVLFCSPMGRTDVAYGPGKAPPCDGLPVTGVDLDKLAEPGMDGDIRKGMARLRGIWRSGTFTVTQQLPYIRPTVPPLVNPEVPCTAPPGGWQTKDTGPMLGDTLQNYIYNTHPEQFKQPWSAYPYGGPVDGRTENWNRTSVLVVGVVAGDVDEARRELEKRYPGNLCVVSSPGQLSIAEEYKVQDIVKQQLWPLMNNHANGIYSLSSKETTINVGLRMLTPQLYEKLKTIPNLHLDPWFVPVN